MDNGKKPVMYRQVNVNPDFSPGAIKLGEIPLFQHPRRVQDELADGLSKQEAVGYLEWMMIVRSFEEMIIAMKSGKFCPVEGFCFIGATHLSIGQEAVAVGAIAAMAPDDYLTSTHRGHGHSIAKGAWAIFGMDETGLKAFLGDKFQGEKGEALREKAIELHLHKTMAELLGKEDGYCRGRGGGMHIADFHVGHLGANAIVGGSYAIGAGAALASQKLGDGKITLCIAGDGATNNGICHEAFNFSCMDQFPTGLPVIFLIENNQYGMTGQQKGEVTGIDHLSQRGAGYNRHNMHAETVNGMSVLTVRDAVKRAAERCRKGEGPVLVECMTYRYMGHSLSDLRTAYRSQDEEATWRAQDAIDNYRSELIAQGVLSEAEAEALLQKAKARIEKAAMSAALSADPKPETIYEGLYTDTDSEGIGDKYKTVNVLRPPRKTRRDAEGRILFRHAINEALMEELERDHRVIFFGEDVADYGGAFQVTGGLIDTFGRDRVFNAPISEAAIAGVAAGASMCGLRPVAELMYIDFVLMAMDQIGNQIAKARYMFGGKATLPLVIRTTVGGGKGYAGQHSQSLEAVLAMFPGLKVVAPSTAYDAKGLLKASIRDDNPVMFLEHQLLYTEKEVVPEEEYIVPLGKARILKEGTDITAVSYLRMAWETLDAAKQLEAEGVSVEVIDPRTLIPLDIETILASVKKTGRLIVICQAPRTGCFAEHIAYQAQRKAFEALKAPVEVIAAHDVPPPMAAPLEKENLPDAARIAEAIRGLLKYGK
jgi:2-oxoisovalerate dehydrogenase E1 component